MDASETTVELSERGQVWLPRVHEVGPASLNRIVRLVWPFRREGSDLMVDDERCMQRLQSRRGQITRLIILLLWDFYATYTSLMSNLYLCMYLTSHACKQQQLLLIYIVLSPHFIGYTFQRPPFFGYSLLCTPLCFSPTILFPGNIHSVRAFPGSCYVGNCRFMAKVCA